MLAVASSRQVLSKPVPSHFTASHGLPFWLTVCALLLQPCTKTTEPSASPPECAPTAMDPSRSYVRLDHRREPIACEASRPCTPIRPSVCRSHGECSEGDNGRCSYNGDACTYDECFGDEDCQQNALCDCAGGPDANHRCLPVECRTDQDCTSGMWCSPSPQLECPQPVVGYFCHTATDECVVDGDCRPAEYCAFNPSSRAWACATQLCER